MSLYEDLPEPEATTSESLPGPALAPSVRAAASAAAAAPPPQLLRGAAVVRSGQQRTGAAAERNPGLPVEGTPSDSAPLAPIQTGCAVTTLVPLHDDEYDCAYPNDYATMKRTLNMVATCAPGSRIRRIGPCSSSGSSSSSVEDVGAIHEAHVASIAAGIYAASQTVAPPNPAVAAMMERMGWTAGTGLGVAQQGRVDPIMAVAHDGRGGLGNSLQQQYAEPRRRRRKFRQSSSVYSRRLRANRAILIQNLPPTDRNRA
jgi:hypothetical protein